MLRRTPGGFIAAPVRMAMEADRAAGRAMAAARRVLVLAGPTCVGKSAAAVTIARTLCGEIVSADSVQVFRGLDVGANKASAAERALVRHHLLDVARPVADEFSAGRFLTQARAATDDILARAQVPVVVGGTMMYVRWFVRGRPSTPPPTPAARARAAAAVDAACGDWEVARGTLAERDPARAAELTQNDWYRLRRALEVAETVPGGVSALPQTGASPKAHDDASDAPYDLRCVFLYDNRIALNRRIDARCETMIAPPAGWESHGGALQAHSVLSETARLLLDCGAAIANTPPARAIGYRQTIRFLTERALLGDEQSATDAFRTFVSDFQQATRNYAKQQMAWFRKEPGFRWVRAGDGSDTVIRNIMELDADEYRTLEECTLDSQTQIREDIIRQGKLMKTYIASKKTLIDNSGAEEDAVRLSVMLAKQVSDGLSTDDLTLILESVRKRE
eukprot:IDg16283t1